MPELASINGGRGESKSTSGSDAGVRCDTVASAVTGVDDNAGASPSSQLVLPRVQSGAGGVAALFGAALRREGSTKGSSNPKAPRATGVPRAGSRRLPAGKAAVVVVAVLPAGKERHAPRRGWRRPAAGARVFASEAVGVAEPASPKVSCFGAVRSERPAPQPDIDQDESGGCWASVTATVRGLCWKNGDPRVGAQPEASESSSGPAASTPESPPVFAVLSPPRLADVKRLASRRWPETMAGEGAGLA